MNDYNFGGLDGWIAEAIHSGVSADVIYKEVIASIRRQVKHHKTCYKTTKELHKLFSNRQYFDVVGDDPDIVNDKINATSPYNDCLLYTSPSPRDRYGSRMPSSA